MKKFFSLILNATMFSFILSSCTNDLQNESLGTDENVITYNSLNELFGIPETNEQTTTNFDVATKAASPTTYTVYGYDSQKTLSQNQKGMFGSELASILGVSTNTVYNFDQYQMTKSITIGDSYIVAMDSPNCGFNPLTSTNQIGYSSSTLDGQFVMATNLVLIKTDASGRSINKWGPRSGDALEWIYGVFE